MIDSSCQKDLFFLCNDHDAQGRIVKADVAVGQRTVAVGNQDKHDVLVTGNAEDIFVRIRFFWCLKVTIPYSFAPVNTLFKIKAFQKITFIQNTYGDPERILTGIPKSLGELTCENAQNMIQYLR